MIQLELPDDTTVSLKGEPDNGFLDFVRDACPDLWQKMLSLKNGTSISIDLLSGDVRVGQDEVHHRVLPTPAVDSLLSNLKTLACLPRQSRNLQSNEDVALVLCGGKGERMRSESLHKVCFPIGTRSVIERALEIYRRAGITQQVVVVGAMADQVIGEVQHSHPKALFAYQAEQMGTGHAALQGARLLSQFSFSGNVMLTMGDKVISQQAIEKLRRDFHEADADLAVTVAPKNRWPGAGRVVYRNNGEVDCSIERSDVDKRMVLQRILNKLESYEITCNKDVVEQLESVASSKRKGSVMFGRALWGLAHSAAPFDRDAFKRLVVEAGSDFEIEESDGRRVHLSAFEIEHRCSNVNISVYYFKADALRYALERIDNANAQGEFYLTDAIQILSRARYEDGKRRFKVIAVEMDDPEDALSFNTPEELKDIEDRIRARTAMKLRQRGVILSGCFRTSWIDDIDSVDKIGVGTELQEPTFIDLGSDPGFRIGKRCRIQGSIINSALGDDCAVSNAKLRNVVAGSEVTVRASEYCPVAVQVIPPRVSIVEGDLTQLQQARAKQRRVLDKIRSELETGGASEGQLRSGDRVLGDVNETNVYIDPRMSAQVLSTRRLLPGTILARRETTTVAEWLKLFDRFGSAISGEFRAIYGTDTNLIEERRQAYVRALSAFGRTFGYNSRVIVSRAPGRINLMGRHVDHQGGHNNHMAIDREVIMVVQRRHDDRVVIQNVDQERFEPDTFLIGQELTLQAGGSWLGWLDSEEMRDKVNQTRGRWGNYVRAALLRLQMVSEDAPLYGMNIMADGNIPIAAGLSSSSAIVVATAEAAVRINGLELTPQQFVGLCGEGEWYVGTRGGSGDHAAMKFGAKGSIAHVRFHPFEVDGFVQFPAGYRVVVCQSQDQSHKAAGARSIFNGKVAAYRLGFLMLKEAFPRHAPKMEHLRDVNTEHLGVGLKEIYEMLSTLPERATRSDIRIALNGEHADKIDEIFSTHDEPEGGYELRKVCLFGLAECARSRICTALLERGDVDAFGELMKISHDGDRLWRLDGGQMVPSDNECSDETLDRLIADLGSGDAMREGGAEIYRQPGGYGCSTKGIDFMVDTACGVEGVVGAQLAGAGLGGCIMVLVQEGRLDALVETMTRACYHGSQQEAEDKIQVCQPIDGSGAISF